MFMRTDPFREFDRLAQQVLGAGTTSRPAVMPMDAWREGDTFIIEFDLPGVRTETLDIDVERNVLTVRAERPRAQRRLGDARRRASHRPVQPAAGARRQPRPRPVRGVLRRRRPAAARPGRGEGQAAQDRGDHRLPRARTARDQLRDQDRGDRRRGPRRRPARPLTPRSATPRRTARAGRRRRAGSASSRRRGRPPAGGVQAEVVEHVERDVPRGRASRCRPRASGPSGCRRATSSTPGSRGSSTVGGDRSVQVRQRRPGPDQVPDAGLDAVLVGRQAATASSAGAPSGCPRRARARRPSRGR